MRKNFPYSLEITKKVRIFAFKIPKAIKLMKKLFVLLFALLAVIGCEKYPEIKKYVEEQQSTLPLEIDEDGTAIIKMEVGQQEGNPSVNLTIEAPEEEIEHLKEIDEEYVHFLVLSLVESDKNIKKLAQKCAAEDIDLCIIITSENDSSDPIKGILSATELKDIKNAILMEYVVRTIDDLPIDIEVMKVTAVDTLRNAISISAKTDEEQVVSSLKELDDKEENLAKQVVLSALIDNSTISSLVDYTIAAKRGLTIDLSDGSDEKTKMKFSSKELRKAVKEIQEMTSDDTLDSSSSN